MKRAWKQISNLSGDGWGWNGSSAGMEMKLDGDGYKICGDRCNFCPRAGL